MGYQAEAANSELDRALVDLRWWLRCRAPREPQGDGPLIATVRIDFRKRTASIVRPSAAQSNQSAGLPGADFKLLDRCDGVQGHYCIGKPMETGGTFWHFWNDECNDWCSAGSVYVGLEAANAKLRELAGPTGSKLPA